MEHVFKYWCDVFLTNNSCYRGGIAKNTPICRIGNPDEREGKLMYQDGTACSASYAFADIYRVDGGYDVYTDWGASHCTGGSQDPQLDKQHFKNIIQVTDYLYNDSGHSPNSTGEMYKCVFARLKALNEPPHLKNGLSECTDPIIVEAIIYGVLDCIKNNTPYNQ
jgi:hypothetical protein